MRRDRDLVSIDAEASAKAVNEAWASPDEIYSFREQLLLYYMGNKHTRFVSGHFLFSERAYQKFQDEYAFIILLRDPVSRWISHYFFNRYKNKKYGKIHSDIIECLESDFGKENGHEYIKFVGGISGAGDYTSDEAIRRAKSNLHKFDIVGCLEYTDNFLDQFHKKFGVKLKLRPRNLNPVSESYRKKIVTNEIHNKIIELCKPDLDLYNYAVKNFFKLEYSL